MKNYETACDQILEDSEDVAIIAGLIALILTTFIWPLPQIAPIFVAYI